MGHVKKDNQGLHPKMTADEELFIQELQCAEYCSAYCVSIRFG